MVGRTVQQYMRAGVAGLHLEDQVQTKRCGHLSGKQLVPEADFVSRIRAAVLAREREGGDIVIIARTDALQSLGYDGAMSRLRAAVAAGADVAFLEGITSREMGERACRELAPTPCLFNCVAHGVSPELSAQEALESGYKVMILPALSMTAIYGAVKGACVTLKETGKAPEMKANSSPKVMFEVCGLRECMEFDAAAGGTGLSTI
jgi:2-methylisocitrate lyase-like PEP mutase family enzyme